jgi:N6-adenosine-specific RNA methylase IME4
MDLAVVELPIKPSSKKPKHGKATVDKKRQLRLEIQQTLIQGCRPIPAGDWGVVSIDPPWHTRLRDDDASHRGRCAYPMMSDEEILALPIGDVAADDAYCLLWTTNNHIELAMQCLRRWNFNYTGGMIVWVKSTKATQELEDDEVKLRIGCGHYVRNAHEIVLIGRRGNVKAWSNLGIADFPSVLIEAPDPQHSRKPEKFYAVAERLRAAIGCSAIDIFARAKRVDNDFWAVWGAESEECIS